MNLWEKIEGKLIDHIIGIAVGLPSGLLATLWFFLGSFLQEDLKNRETIRILWSLVGSLLLATLILGSFVFILIRKHGEKPDFSQFIHKPEDAYWVHKKTGQRICEICKTEQKLVPLSRFGDDWRCPIHKDIVAGCNHSHEPRYYTEDTVQYE